ncbi:hypothetical protein SAZ10_00515 [Mesorhizobium sp. BAC0120]|uniref:hypothetical protein n=1 Tax=Mesorhizobium sp. BAC0120 TaxID=3090670 RepID=UPI00298D2C76|nr:hypothetical protein [Mesorhizobium sp. BAC0120]MDW6020238.1 hypothetical protein [Mesorhizobium sp. BAC0120]
MQAFGWSALKRKFVFSFVLTTVLLTLGLRSSPAGAESYKIHLLITGPAALVAEGSQVCDVDKECTVRVGGNFFAYINTEKRRWYNDPDGKKFYKISIYGEETGYLNASGSSHGYVYIYDDEKRFVGDLYYATPDDLAYHIMPKYGRMYVILEK